MIHRVAGGAVTASWSTRGESWRADCRSPSCKATVPDVQACTGLGGRSRDPVTLRNPSDARVSVEALVEAEDPIDSVVHHRREMERIARR